VPELDDLLRPLVDHPHHDPPPMDELRAGARHHAVRRRAAVTLVVVAAVALPLAVATRPTHPQKITTGSRPAGSASTASTASTENGAGMVPLEPTTTTLLTIGSHGEVIVGPRRHEQPPGSTTVPTAQSPAPPWAGPKLPASAAPEALAAYRADPNIRNCPAVAPTDLGDGAGATARVRDRSTGSGAWGVDYDMPGKPGLADVQYPTMDAGKDTFSIDVFNYPGPGDPANNDVFANQLRWSDGSHGSYGAHGFGPPFFNGVPSWTSYLQIGDDPRCVYGVSSFLSLAHVRYLIDHLRFVEGAP
jgi:hypothetical protein